MGGGRINNKWYIFDTVVIILQVQVTITGASGTGYAEASIEFLLMMQDL